jgi:hypothetical protein
MGINQAYRNWWRPLPTWLKAATTLAALPAWFVIIFAIAAGKAESMVALTAFGVFVAVVVLHIAFDGRNSRGPSERHGGVDLMDGE